VGGLRSRRPRVGPASVSLTLKLTRFSLSLTPPRLRRGGVPAREFSHGGHGGSAAAPPTPPSRTHCASAFGLGTQTTTWRGGAAAPPTPPSKTHCASAFGLGIPNDPFGPRLNTARPWEPRKTHLGTMAAHPESGAGGNCSCVSRTGELRAISSIASPTVGGGVWFGAGAPNDKPGAERLRSPSPDRGPRLTSELAQVTRRITL
jgi:hypothetical protein